MIAQARQVWVRPSHDRLHRFRRTGITEYLAEIARRSLRLDVGRPDYLTPLLSVVCDELAEIGGRAAQQRTAEVHQSCLKFRIIKTSVDLFVEFSMISEGVFLGVPRPNRELAS